jgi:hypothetical protein
LYHLDQTSMIKRSLKEYLVKSSRSLSWLKLGLFERKITHALQSNEAKQDANHGMHSEGVGRPSRMAHPVPQQSPDKSYHTLPTVVAPASSPALDLASNTSLVQRSGNVVLARNED